MELDVERHEEAQQAVMSWTNRAFVGENLRCPRCGEIRRRRIAWVAMDKVRCTACGTQYRVWVNRAD